MPKTERKCLSSNLRRFIVAIKSGNGMEAVDEHRQYCVDCDKYLAVAEDALAGNKPLNQDEKIFLIRLIADKNGYVEIIYKDLIAAIEKNTAKAEHRVLDELVRLHNNMEQGIEQNKKQTTRSIKKLSWAVAILFLFLTVLCTAFIYTQYRPYLNNQIKIENGGIYQSVKRYERVCALLESMPLDKKLVAEKKSLEDLLLCKNEASKPKPVDIYANFDFLFNQYIKTRDEASHQKLLQMAAIMQANKDQFGTSLLQQLSTLKGDQIDLYYTHRSKLLDIENKPVYATQDIKEIGLAQAIEFFKVNQLESDGLRASTLLARSLIFSNQFKEAQQILDGLSSMALQNNQLFALALIDSQMANLYGNTSVFDSARVSISNEITRLNALGAYKNIAGARMVLAGIETTLNNNQEGFLQGIEALKLIDSSNSRHYSSIYGWMAFACAGLDDNYTASLYLENAIIQAQVTNAHYNLSTLRSYIAVIKAKQLKFLEAKSLFQQAFQDAEQVTGVQQIILKINLNGFYGKFMMLASRPSEALVAYDKALSLYDQANEQSYLELADLHEGKGQALVALNRIQEAREELALIENLRRTAFANRETRNQFLSFIAIDRPLKDFFREVNQ